MELVSRVPPLALKCARGGASRGSHAESPAASASMSMRPSGGRKSTTDACGNSGMLNIAGEGGPGKAKGAITGPTSRGEAGSGDDGDHTVSGVCCVGPVCLVRLHSVPCSKRSKFPTFPKRYMYPH